jgi:hypothetical protein
MKTIITLLLLISVNFSFAQKISNIEFNVIKEEITDSTSSNFYSTLIERFVEADTSLTEKEFKLIYYGNVFSENYKPYSSSKSEDKFLELYNKEKYKKAIPYGEKVLLENPVNLKISFKMLVCHDVLEDKVKVKHYAKRYFPLLGCIYKSGDGNSISTAYVVIKVADEYEILADLGISMASQSLVGSTDKLEINTKIQKEEKRKEIIEQLYFNVSKPLDYLTQQFRKNDK